MWTKLEVKGEEAEGRGELLTDEKEELEVEELVVEDEEEWEVEEEFEKEFDAWFGSGLGYKGEEEGVNKDDEL